jgi:hypothetical protein
MCRAPTFPSHHPPRKCLLHTLLIPKRRLQRPHFAGNTSHGRMYVPTWSPLYRKLQRRSRTPLHNPRADVPDAGTDSRRSALTKVEPPPKDSSASIAELTDISTEIPETPAAALNNMRHETDNNSDDGNTLYLRFTRVNRNC